MWDIELRESLAPPRQALLVGAIQSLDSDAAIRFSDDASHVKIQTLYGERDLRKTLESAGFFWKSASIQS